MRREQPRSRRFRNRQFPSNESDYSWSGGDLVSAGLLLEFGFFVASAIAPPIDELIGPLLATHGRRHGRRRRGDIQK